MKIGITGPPGSGKSTVFNAITQKITKERDLTKPHLAVIFVPDERLDFLASLLRPKKVRYPEMTFIDLPGYKPGDIKEVDAIVLCIGTFSGREVLKDLRDFEADLILRDLEAIQNRLARLEKEVKRGGQDLLKNEYETLIACKASLEKEQELRFLELTPLQEKLISGYQFLSRRPFVVISNIAEDGIGKGAPAPVEKHAAEKGLKVIEFCGQIESEIAELPEEERPGFLKDAGIESPARDKFIRAAYGMFKIIRFYTTKNDEARSWTIREGTTALEAAGKIHTDIKRGFIRAEVVNFRDFKECGTFAAAKEKGVLRLEGKEYVVKDGDIVNFRFNV